MSTEHDSEMGNEEFKNEFVRNEFDLKFDENDVNNQKDENEELSTRNSLHYHWDGSSNKRRNKFALAAMALLLVFGMLLMVGLMSPEETAELPDAKSSWDGVGARSAGSTTLSVPTPFGITTSPTIPPTYGGPRPTSRLPCDEIMKHPNVTGGDSGCDNFEIYTLNHGVQVCADTYGGLDPREPRRSFWQASDERTDCLKLDFDKGTAVCENAGARRCTADELAQKAGQGSGCGGDYFMLYTSTTCREGCKDGFLQINLSLKNGGTFFQCQTDLTDETFTRCCGDIF